MKSLFRLLAIPALVLAAGTAAAQITPGVTYNGNASTYTLVGEGAGSIPSAHVGTHYAAWASDAEQPVRAEAAAMAKAFVPEAANFVTGECIQIHGGVGFTWDADPHVFYRKAKQNDLLLGYHGLHRRRVADFYLDRA